MAMNKVMLQGRITKDLEKKVSTNGISIMRFSLAVDQDFKDKTTGQRGCDFVNCVAFRQTADFMENYTGKGQMVVVVGRLSVQNYEDKDGNKRTSTEVNVENVYLCGGSKPASQGGQSAAPQSNGETTESNANYSGFAEVEGGDGDLPF